jgi:predicted metal-dependent HD superfamily phosphohydrolase
MERKDEIIVDAMRVWWGEVKEDILFYDMTHCMDEKYFDEYYDKVLVPTYTASHLHYHTMTHVFHVFNAVLEFDVLAKRDRTRLKLGAIFHDITYVPGMDDNELISAEVFGEFAEKVGMEKSDIKCVKGLIMATTHREKYLSWIGESMCDADLKEMAGTNYMDNSILIRKEFSYLSDEEWRKGRMEFLRTFLDKLHVFRTDQFRNLYEKKAQANLKAEYEYLKGLKA